MQQPTGHLRSDPLPRVLRGGEENGRTPTVPALVGVLGDLQDHDVLAVEGLADDHRLDDVAVLARRGEELVLDASRFAIGPEHVEACGCLQT